MARKYLTHLDMTKNEVQNAVIQNLPGAPANPVAGQVYFDTGTTTLYWCKVGGGSPSWISAQGGSSAFPGFGAVAPETAFGGTSTDGAGGTVARNDHKHGTPTHDSAAHAAVALGSLNSAFGLVTAETTFAGAKFDGIGTSAARNDHTHGNPTHDNAAHSAITALAGGNASGDLSGTYPGPSIALLAVTAAKIANATITDTQVAAANKDGGDTTPGMRTLGLTGGKAMPGRYDLATIALTNATSNNISMNNNYLTGLPATPPPQGDYAASKAYVDSVAQGLDAKQSVRGTTLSDLGGSFNATGGTGGVARITNAGGFTFDYGHSAGDRVLVKNQTVPAQNGIYTLVTATTADRASDMDTWTEVPGAFVFVEQGNTQADTGWVCTADQGGTLNTTAITWTQFSSAGSVTAGAGMTQAGQTLNVIATDASLVINPDDMRVGYASTGGDYGTLPTAARSNHLHDASYVPVARTVSTTAPLTGGGALSANLTLAISNFTSGAAGAVPASGGGTAKFLRADATWQTPTAGLATALAYTGNATSTVVPHSLAMGTNVMVQVYRNSAPYDTIECDVERTSATSVTVRFTAATALNEYAILLIG